jgi:hypothetical protein
MLGSTPPLAVRAAGPQVNFDLASPPPKRWTELQLLNGTPSTRSRYALKSNFHPINGATGARMFGVRFQTGGNNKSNKVHPSSMFENAEPVQLHAPGAPYWLQSQSPHISIPRSTTHSAHTSVPTDSHLLDRQSFHM